MASPARITEVLPETLPEDFAEWDEASRSAQSIQSGGGEPGPGVEPVSTPVTQDAEAHRAGAPSGNLPRGAELSVLTLENAWGGAVPHPARSSRPAFLSSRDIVVLLVAIAIVIMILVFNREPDTFVDDSEKPGAAPGPTTAAIQQPQGAAPTRAHSTPTVPGSAAAPNTAGEVQNNSEAGRQPVQRNVRPSREQARMMDDQLSTPSRLQMNALSKQTPLPPGGFGAADIDGLDNSNAIGAVFGSPKQPTVQIASQEAISVPSSVAMGLLIQQTQPVYPLIAKQGQVSGTIVLAATISKAGNVENLRVVSGPGMLRMSAVNAVRTWRFKPYMIDNQPTAIETTINVHFCGETEPCVSGRRK